MPNAESAVSRITRLCAVVDRPKLAAWIGGRDAFKKLPQSSFVQRLFQGTTYVDVLCGLTSMVCRCDVSIDGSMLEELAAELAAMPQVSEFPEDFWHKYPIDAVLAKYDTITSRIKVSTTSSVKLVGKFDSHRCVASTATEMGVATQIAEALNSSLSVILYGESGSGKTTAMLLAAVALADTMNKDQLTALALYTDLSGIEDRFRSIENPTQAPMDAARCTLRAGEVRVHPLEGVDWEDACGCRLCTRDHEAAKILVALCGVLRTEGDAVQPYHAVIVVDELGSYPSFVRAVCALGQPLRTALAAHLRLARVSIVMGGTGSESPDLSPGSLPNTPRPIHVTTNLWPALVKSMPGLLTPFDVLMAPPNVAGGLPDARSVTAKLAHDLSSNARAAALLASALRTAVLATPAGDVRNYSLLFGMAALSAAFEYKKRTVWRASLRRHTACLCYQLLRCRTSCRATRSWFLSLAMRTSRRACTAA